MKKLLCRHKDNEWFERCGYGLILEEECRFCRIKWLGNKHVVYIKKSFLYILDENEVDGWR